jgi:hypothetical protein
MNWWAIFGRLRGGFDRLSRPSSVITHTQVIHLTVKMDRPNEPGNDGGKGNTWVPFPHIALARDARRG